MNIRASLTELCDGFNAHDLDRIMSLFSDDCVLEMPRGSHPFGTRFEGKRKVLSVLSPVTLNAAIEPQRFFQSSRDWAIARIPLSSQVWQQAHCTPLGAA
jgi:ketosteroid isomerase-like protein